tara:strand:+ start:73 stop:477 length:405 start_codon:yes stop_codon:yes gene_type:complete
MSLRFKKTFKNPVLFLLIGTALLFSQCKKDPTKMEIRIVELSTGAAVANSEITLFVDSSSTTGFFVCDEGFINEKKYVTNANGQTTECFDTPALLNVTVISYFPAVGGGTTQKFGTGKLNLIEHETTSLTISVN